jgi:hypothetical protein
LRLTWKIWKWNDDVPVKSNISAVKWKLIAPSMHYDLNWGLALSVSIDLWQESCSYIEKDYLKQENNTDFRLKIFESILNQRTSNCPENFHSSQGDIHPQTWKKWYRTCTLSTYIIAERDIYRPMKQLKISMNVSISHSTICLTSVLTFN